MPTPSLALDKGRVLLVDAVLVYLERTVASPEPLPSGVAPRAYGLAPAAIVAPDAVLAAVGPGEAIWLGFQATDPRSPVVLRVRVEGPQPLDAVTGEPWGDTLADEPGNHLLCPPDYCLPGLRRPDGYVPFEQGELSVLALQPTPGRASVRIVDFEAFSELTGREPEPLDPESAYKGWRLP
jgi:hypothetical protein